MINQEDSIVIRDYNSIKSKTKNLTNGSSCINTLNKNKWLVVQLPQIPREQKGAKTSISKMIDF